MSTDHIGSHVSRDDARPAGAKSSLTKAMLGAVTLQNAIFNSANVAIVATDARGIIQLFNAGAERMLGYAARDVLNKLTLSDIHALYEGHGDSELPSTKAVRPMAPGLDAPFPGVVPALNDEHELIYLRKDRNGLPTVMSITLLRDEHHEFVGNLLVGIRDVGRGPDGRTAKLQESQHNLRESQNSLQESQDSLHESQELFRLAVESALCGIVMIDGAGKIILVNSALELMFDYQYGALIGQPVDVLVPERLRSQYVKYRDNFLVHPQTRFMEGGRDLFGRRKDGSEFPIEVALNPIHAGEDLLVLSVVIDISERQRTERLKDEFVSTVSHELRTPLTSIAGALGLLIGNAAGKLPEAATRLLAIAHTNSQRLVRLINDILDIEKIESGRVVFHLRRLDLHSLLEQAIEANRGFAESYDVRIRLLDTPVPCTVRADADRLAQVVTNLLSNAIKFSPPGEEVTVGVEPRGEWVSISVRDHGPGVPASFRTHIFEKFAQGDATDARQKGGTGLGLSIVKQLTTRLGGDVGFDDAPGGGTIFHIELPSWKHIVSQEIDPDADPDAARVLLCENDLDNAIALREQLQKIGCATDFACTIDDALARAAATSYSAIVVDLDLPDGGDGLHLILRLRDRVQSHRTPIIAVADDPNRGRDDPRSSSLNVLDWIAKPLDIGHLVQVLTKWMVRDATGRPTILHVDDDPDALRAVAAALGSTVDLVSVDTIEEARRAIGTTHFDLAILDIVFGAGSGLDLLPYLRDVDDHAIPVIIFSLHGAELACDEQIQAALSKSHASIEGLLAAIRDRLAQRPSRASKEAS